LIELEREPILLGDLVSGAFKPLEHRFESRGMQLDLESSVADIVVDGDSQRLQMVLKNLAENALKYGHSGGKLVLSTLIADGGSLEIWACDDDRGLPPDERERVFERFYRGSNAGDEAGNGLGLAIARSVVRAHGGDLRCEANEGPGACFVIELPGIQVDGDPVRSS
jgi:signal transduction histidine kinase